MLIGEELLSRVKELGDVSKADLVRGCGYCSIQEDGSERLNFTAFYDAILEAKGAFFDSDNAIKTDQGASTEIVAEPVSVIINTSVQNVLSVGSSKPAGQLPAGVYWIGDLSYVFEDFFDQCLDELQGVHATKSGLKFAIFNTANGDGIFVDNDGDEYGVDVSNIGCIPLDAIDEESGLGHLVRFSAPFACQYIAEGGMICFGDLSIKTDLLSESRNPIEKINPPASAEYINGNVLIHMKLRPEGLGFSELILRDVNEVDSHNQLVIREIAYYINDIDRECGDALLTYEEFDDDQREHMIWMFYIVFHSELDEFTEYFRGYYASPDNKLHEINFENGNTDVEVYEFLDALDWKVVFNTCRKHCNSEGIASMFSAWTGFNYEEEKDKYPVDKWDGKPRWSMKDGKYLSS
jgi:hypothetical protein